MTPTTQVIICTCGVIIAVCITMIAAAARLMKREYKCNLFKEFAKFIARPFRWVLYKILYALLWCLGWVLIGYATLFNDQDLLTDDFYE